MMKSAPSAPLVVTQTELLLEFLVVAFNAPAQLTPSRSRQCQGQALDALRACG